MVKNNPAVSGEDLAAAMNNLADAINNLSELLRELRRDDPNWNGLPTILADMNKRLMTLSTRL